MKKIFKLSLNSVLLAIFLSMVILPMAFMGAAGYEEKPTVLSAQDSKEPPVIRAADDPEAHVPEDVKNMILRMEREYYQNQDQTFTEDVERDEENEQVTLPEEENSINQGNIEENSN